MENRIEIPKQLVKKAHEHAVGAIRELERQLSLASTENKKNKLKTRINRWNKVVADIDLLLNGAHAVSADSSRLPSDEEGADRRGTPDDECALPELPRGT